jgi:hypothetical protein
MHALNGAVAALLLDAADELPPAGALDEVVDFDLLPHAANTSTAETATVAIFIPRDTCKTDLPLDCHDAET